MYFYDWKYHATIPKQRPELFWGLRPATLLKKRLWHRCFPVYFSKFLRTLFLQSTSRLLLIIHIKKTFIFTNFIDLDSNSNSILCFPVGKYMHKVNPKGTRTRFTNAVLASLLLTLSRNLHTASLLLNFLINS